MTACTKRESGTAARERHCRRSRALLTGQRRDLLARRKNAGVGIVGQNSQAVGGILQNLLPTHLLCAYRPFIFLTDM
jgi:hypothetical protein